MSSLGTYLEYIGHNGIRVPRGHWTNKENHKNDVIQAIDAIENTGK